MKENRIQIRLGGVDKTLMFIFRRKGDSSLGKEDSFFKGLEAVKRRGWVWWGGVGCFKGEVNLTMGREFVQAVGKDARRLDGSRGGYGSLGMPAECFELYWICMVSLSHLPGGMEWWERATVRSVCARGSRERVSLLLFLVRFFF